MALFSSKSKDPNALLARGKHKEALKGFQTMLDNNPDDINVRIKLAETYVHLKAVDDAVHHFELAAEDYAHRGFLIKAIALHKKILKIAPDREENHQRLAELSAEHQGSKAGGAKIPPPTKKSKAPASEKEHVTAEIKILDEVGKDDFAPDIAPHYDTDATSAALEDIPDIPKGKSAETREAGWDHVRVPLFSDLKPEEFEKVVQKIKHHEYKEVETVIREGEKGDSMFVISEGEVRVLTRDPQGNDMELTRLGEGDFFGEVSLLKGVARTATVKTSAPSEILEFTRSDMNEIAKTHPAIMKVVENFYFERVNHTIETMKERLRSG